MEFKKYSSLENAYRQKFIDSCHELGIEYWVSLEKIHGANFSFICDENMQVTPAKRTSVLEKNEHGNYDFYGCNPIVEKYEFPVQRLAQQMGCAVQVFGELYGEGVQKEVKYGEKDFIAYDILLADGTFLNWPEVKAICSRVGIPTVPEIAKGTLEEMLSISPEFTSVLCEDKAEGLIIKPWVDRTLLKTGSRPVIKSKSQAFSEKKERKAKQPRKMPEHVLPLFGEFLTYLNESRLRNVLSKIGEVTQKDFGRLVGALVQDAKQEFERDEYTISKDDWNGISKPVAKEASNTIRQHWLNILDSNF